MKTERIKKRTRVHWEYDSEETNQSSRQLFFFKKSLSEEKLFHLMRKKIIESTKQGDYGIFDSYIKEKNVSEQQLRNFYRDEWLYVMFYSSVNTYTKSDLLQFFSHHLTKADAKYLLEFKDREILVSFIQFHEYSRNDSQDVGDTKDEWEKRLLILLQINEEVITEFMQRSDIQTLIPASVRLEYQTVLEKFKCNIATPDGVPALIR